MRGSKDTEYLLSSKDKDESSILASRVLYRNFIFMCTAFSLNHGSVVSCLTYATTELGDELGGYGSGCLYVCYALTAFLIAKPIVTTVGPKNGLLLGLIGYCIYVVGFLIALLSPLVAWPVFLFAASIGGISGGLLWPAQGRYFALNAEMYAKSTQLEVAEVNSNFAAIFATFYLGFEMLTKVLATVVFLSIPQYAPTIIFSIYTVIAVSCVFVVIRLKSLGERGSWDLEVKPMLTSAFSAADLLYKDFRLDLLIPFQIAFGFASSFVPYYVFGTIVADSDELGGTYVGLLSAIVVLTGATFAIPAARLANTIGKAPLMVVGGLCMVFTGLILFVLSDETLGTWGVIIPYLIIYGMGRGTWENTNKAVVADLFTKTPGLCTAAFSSVSFTSGLAGAIGYFTFSSLVRNQIAGLVGISSIVAIISFMILQRFLKNENIRKDSVTYLNIPNDDDEEIRS